MPSGKLLSPAHSGVGRGKGDTEVKGDSVVKALEQVSDSILRVGLLSESDVVETCRELEERHGTVDGSSLLGHLAATGRITRYQARQLARGRGRQLVLGNYLVLNRVGQGGMGTVFRALHRRMDRVVAVKVINQKIAGPDFVRRFRREIQVAARLNHPQIVAAFDADECELGDFLVMEFVEGSDFARVIRKWGPLAPVDAMEVIRQAAMGLSYAHSQGVIHRDIKPANLMRDIHGAIKVADLGLARLSSASENVERDADVSQTGLVTGTINFMAPEQAFAPESADHRADVYGLGCTLFALCTGEPLFDRPSIPSLLMAHRDSARPSLCDVCPEASAELDAVLQKMIAPEPSDRFQTMDDVVEALTSLKPRENDLQLNDWQPTKTTVLLVEESKLQASIITKMLAELGVDDVHIRHTARDAIDTLLVTPAQLVMTSMMLPDRTGLQLAETIRSKVRWSPVAVMLMTSSPLPEHTTTALRHLSRVGILEKPFTAAQLNVALKAIFSSDAEAPISLANLESLHVLVVDDSSVARRHVRQVLGKTGFTQLTDAEDGVAAVAAMDDRRFDLIVTDYNMPRMNGHELVAYIRGDGGKNTHKNVPIVMVTTEFDPTKLAEIYKLGVSAICDKSFDLEMVRNIVLRLFL